MATEAEKKEALEREFARQQAWADVEHAVKKALQLEKMRRLKLDYSLYGEGEEAELFGSNEIVAQPKRPTADDLEAMAAQGRDVTKFFGEFKRAEPIANPRRRR